MEDFDIDINAIALKEFVAKFDVDDLLMDIADVLTYVESPRIPFYPFEMLDSPLRQLAYIGSLNVNSDKSKEVEHRRLNNDEWKEIIRLAIKVKAGYYELLLPNKGDNEDEHYHYYKVAMPVFMNHYNQGELKYEEQEIEKIISLFSPFNNDILKKFGLEVNDFISIYNIFDKLMVENLKRPSELRDDPECDAFWELMRKNKTSPHDWKYEGNNLAVLSLIKYFTGHAEGLKITKTDLYKEYDEKKVEAFLNIFTVKKFGTEYLYPTESNTLLNKPLYQLSDGRILVITIKQLIHAIYYRLNRFVYDENNKVSIRYFEHRGKWLQDKTVQVLNKFFKNEATIYNEYRLSPNGDRQDVLLLHKSGLCLIVESKAGKEKQPHKFPKDTIKVYQPIYDAFKKNIQEGYDQCYRVKKVLDDGLDFHIYNKNNKFLYHVKNKKYPTYFSLIVTSDNFRRPQVDLELMLNLDVNDDTYPFSVSIENLEVILLTLRKKKLGIGDFIKFLQLREQLQGRIDCDDELELWGGLINIKNFEIPEDERWKFISKPELAYFYDELYKTGLGLKNEKNWAIKKSGKAFYYEPAKFVKAYYNKNQQGKF